MVRELRHQNVVELYDEVEVSGHAALFMAAAGSRRGEDGPTTYTLAQRIREEGRLSLDLLQRFGEELLGVVEWLESRGRLAPRHQAGQRGDRADAERDALARALRLLAVRDPGREHPGRDAALPRPLPRRAEAAAVGPLRRAVRGGDDAVRDGDGPAPDVGRRPVAPVPR